jgi:hypothetical protein
LHLRLQLSVTSTSAKYFTPNMLLLSSSQNRYNDMRANFSMIELLKKALIKRFTDSSAQNALANLNLLYSPDNYFSVEEGSMAR